MKIKLTLLLFGTLAMARADMTVVQEVSSNDTMQSMSQEMTIMVSKGRLRIEHPQAGILTLPDQSKNIMLVHPQKMYMIMPSMDSMMGMAGASGDSAAFASPERIAWTKTGQKDKIAGYDAEQWLGKDTTNGKQIVEVWVGGKAELISEYVDSLGKMGSGMIASFASQLKSGSGEGPFKYGYPLKTIMYNDSGVATTTTLVKKLDASAVDPKWFSIPADYQQMQMPGGMGQPPTGGGAAGAGGMPPAGQ